MAGPPSSPQPLVMEVREPAWYKKGAGVFAGPLGDHAVGGETSPPDHAARGRLPRVAFGAHMAPFSL